MRIEQIIQSSPRGLFFCYNYMNEVTKGKISFLLSILRHLILLIPVMLIMDRIIGMSSLIWSPLAADLIGTAISYIVYLKISVSCVIGKMKELSERDRQAKELSLEIMELTRNTIIVNLRFMDRAVGNITAVPDMNFGFAGNGRYILYSPWTLIITYRQEQSRVTRDLLHCIFHNIFRHSMIGEGLDRVRWDLACDIVAESSIFDLHRDFLYAERESEQKDIIEHLRGELGYLTAERIYHYLSAGSVSMVTIHKWAEHFAGDQHDLWYGGNGSDYLIPDDIDLEELWKDISRKMLTELEALGAEDGALTQNLREINRVRYNYKEFLRRFGRQAERMRLSEEEFDNNYYTYGIELYGDIPLIEPLEYRDMRDIRDFVIAIDTSGSVQGEVVQKFVQHTHDVLAEQNSFGTSTNLYIIQCDDEIRDVALIRNKQDFDDYFREKKIQGLGRTDFRPVFRYVSKLLEEGKLRDMRGLLYFTDGKGKFPAKAPDYETAFIIHNDSFGEVWVPEWAMKVEMPSDEIMNL